MPLSHLKILVLEWNSPSLQILNGELEAQAELVVKQQEEFLPESFHIRHFLSNETVELGLLVCCPLWSVVDHVAGHIQNLLTHHSSLELLMIGRNSGKRLEPCS